MLRYNIFPMPDYFVGMSHDKFLTLLDEAHKKRLKKRKSIDFTAKVQIEGEESEGPRPFRISACQYDSGKKIRVVARSLKAGSLEVPSLSTLGDLWWCENIFNQKQPSESGATESNRALTEAELYLAPHAESYLDCLHKARLTKAQLNSKGSDQGTGAATHRPENSPTPDGNVEKCDSVPSAMTTDEIAQLMPEDGLIIIFGTTGCGKSTAADSIAESIMEFARSGHVLRFGDPVESQICRAPTPQERKKPMSIELDSVKQDLEDPSVPVTCRNFPEDVRSLEDFKQDALRQRPRLITISELRTDDDINTALNLASTGHLVVATAHASSLRDGFLRLMRAYGCFESERLKLPLAKSLRAVIHLESRKLTDETLRKLLADWTDKPDLKLGIRLIRSTVWERTRGTEYQFISSDVERIIPSSDLNADCRSALWFLRHRKESYADNLIKQAAGGPLYLEIKHHKEYVEVINDIIQRLLGGAGSLGTS